jgi:hypothetical protein
MHKGLVDQGSKFGLQVGMNSLFQFPGQVLDLSKLGGQRPDPRILDPKASFHSPWPCFAL